jgi:hypothetical protein
MAVAGVPRPIAELDVMGFGEPKAFPLTSGWQTALASTSKLVGQRHLLAVGVAEDDGAELAGVAIIGAKDLFPADHRSFKRGVDLAGHLASRHPVILTEEEIGKTT